MVRLNDYLRAGEDMRRIRAEPVDRFICGVDLGQASDPSAVCVLHYRVVPLDTWTMVKRTATVATIKQDSETHLDVRHLSRLPLHMPYTEQVSHIASIIARPPLRGNVELALDFTGVGRPVADLFERAGLKPLKICITGGMEPTQVSETVWHVPKPTLISHVDARLHADELRFAPELLESDAMREELKNFQRYVSTAGRHTYEARAGLHDDLVLAVSVAVFAAIGRPPPPITRVGTYILG